MSTKKRGKNNKDEAIRANRTVTTNIGNGKELQVLKITITKAASCNYIYINQKDPDITAVL